MLLSQMCFLQSPVIQANVFDFKSHLIPTHKFFHIQGIQLTFFN